MLQDSNGTPLRGPSAHPGHAEARPDRQALVSYPTSQTPTTLEANSFGWVGARADRAGGRDVEPVVGAL
jgi:hypothetical protein